MDTSGVSRAISILVLIVVLGGGAFAAHKYFRSRPNGLPPVVRDGSSLRPKSGFGSRPTDFADPRTTTLRYVSKFEAERQGVRPNTTVGGRR